LITICFILNDLKNWNIFSISSIFNFFIY
jgi:hypothetical protein